MQKRSLQAIAICITAGMLLGEPAVAYAANTDQSVVQEVTENQSADNDTAPAENVTPTDEGTENNTPVDGAEENNAPVEDGEENNAPAEGGEDNNAPTEEGEENNAPAEGEEGNNTPAEGEEGENAPVDGEGTTDESTDGEEGTDAPTEEEEAPVEGEEENTDDSVDGEGNVDGAFEEEESEISIEDDELAEDEELTEDEEAVEDEEKELTEEEKLKLLEEEKLLEEQKLLEQKKLEEAKLLEETEEITAADGTWNILDFGAVSGADSTYAINQALAKVTYEAPYVRIPAGTYQLKGWLNVPTYAQIIFEDGASLVGDGSCGGLLIQGGGNIAIHNPVIKNVSCGIQVISNNGSVKIAGGLIEPISNGVGITLTSASDVEIHERGDGYTSTTINNSKFGILINGGTNIKINSATISNHSMGGIWVQNNAAAVNISSCTIKGGKQAGIWLSECKSTTVSDCTITENGDSTNQSTYGIKLGSAQGVVISNNNIVSNIKDGINIDAASTGVTVQSNTIQSNGAIGVVVGNGSSATIANNIIKQNKDHGIIFIQSFGAIKNNTIDGTNSVGTPDRANHYGIIVFCRNAADKNSVIEVSNNTVNGMIGNGIQVTGDKTNPSNEGAINVLVSGNKVSNVGDNGITVNYNSHNANITGNTVTGAGVNGIDIQGGSKNCTITNNIVKNSGYMGISIGSGTTGAGVSITGNTVDASANVGIHVNNSASTATVSNNKVTNHSGNFSIAVVNGAKASLAQNTVTMPMSYIKDYAGVAQYSIFVGDGTATTNGAVKFNFKPNIPGAGATSFTGSGTPGLTTVLNLNGTSKSATIGSNWQYSIGCNALKTTDTYSISAKDAYNNMITYTNGAIITQVDETKVKAFVERMYTVALNRPADTNGCNYWVNQLVTGAKDGAIVAKGFVLSPEMERRNLNNDQFVTMLYRTFFDREPAAGDSGKAFWINLLENGVSRAYVFRGFCHSAEFTAICDNYGITRGNVTLTENRDQKHDVTMYVYRCYNRTLGRTPDVNGLNYWTGQILTKERNPSEVAANFVFSAEFKNKKLSDEEYIKVMYRMFFDREFDQSGLNFWLNEIKSGNRDRYKVFTGFANSKEFKAVLQKFGL